MPENVEAPLLAYRYTYAAALLGPVHKDTIARWVKAGHIKSVVIGGTPMIPASEVERLLGEAK